MLLTASASASVLNTAAASLRSDPVYVGAPTITSAQAESLRAEIRAGNRPMFVAILPRTVGPEVHNNPSLLATAVAHATGLDGTYAVVAGRYFRATSSDLPNAPQLATESFQKASSGGVYAVLADYVHRVESAPMPGGGGGSRSSSGGLSGGAIAGIVIGALIALALVGWLVVRRMRFRAAKGGLAQDIDGLAERADSVVVSEDDSRFASADRARSSLIAARRALKGAHNHYDLENVRKLVRDAQDSLGIAESLVREGQGRRWTGTPPTEEEDTMFQRVRNSVQRQRANNGPSQRVAAAQRPTPTYVVNNGGIPGGYGYYYPQYGGWGYWDPYGSFLPLAMESAWLSDMYEPTSDFDWDDHSSNIDFGDSSQVGGGDFATTPDTGGGDFGSSSSDDYGSSGGGDFSSGGGFDSGSGGGGFDSGGGGFDSGGGGGGDFGGGGGDGGGGF